MPANTFNSIAQPIQGPGPDGILPEGWPVPVIAAPSSPAFPAALQGSVVDPNNSTSTPLGAGGIFDGTYTDVRGYASLSVLWAATGATSGGVSIFWSNDGITDHFSVSSNTDNGVLSDGVVFPILGSFARVRFLNSLGVQASFTLVTLLHPVFRQDDRSTPEVHLANTTDTFSSSSGGGISALGVRQNAQNALATASGRYAPIQVDNVGNIRISWYPDRVTKGRFASATFRTLGNAASPQNLLTLGVAAGSTFFAIARRIRVSYSPTAALAALESTVGLGYTTALPSAGTALAKVQLDSSEASSANVVIRGANAVDGGAATPITATIVSAFRRAFISRLHTAVGWLANQAISLIDEGDTPGRGVIVRANQGIVVQVENPVAANNPATNHYVIEIEWEEFSAP